MKKIEHIGIAVNNLSESESLFTALLGKEPYKRETVESEEVITSFYKTGDSKIELLESTDPNGAIARFLDRRGEGIHHIAFEVEDIRSKMAELRDAGFKLLSEKPRVGADNKWVAFVHPKSAHGVLVELCQERPNMK